MSPPQAAADPQLPIASITASARPEQVGAMSDGQLTTRWETAMPQAPGDRVVITLGSVATVSRLELDLGEFDNDYPRKLRVDVDAGDGTSTTVWEGRTSGRVVTALLKDRIRLPIVIDLPEGTRAREVTLTIVDGHPEYWWSIAELRVYGR